MVLPIATIRRMKQSAVSYVLTMNEVVVVVVVGCDSSWRYCYIHTNFLLSCCTLHSPAAL